MDTIKKSLYTFNTDRQIAFYDKKIGLTYRSMQLLLFSFILYDLFLKQLYFKTEIPSGYTTMWAEANNLYDIQSNATKSQPIFCNNKDHNYIYSLPYWDYRNNSCINLHYSEMYEKGENEIFFQTYFTENKIILQDCNHFNYSNDKCDIIDTLDGQCFCQSYKNFYSVGVEGMQLVFNHLYTTSFESGSNVESNGNIKPIKTIINDANGNKMREFDIGENIALTIEEWLELANIDLNDFNYGVKKSEEGYNITEYYPKYRLTGLEIILKVNFYNIKKLTNFEETICVIDIVTNKGWASKGSKINYINYPDLLDGFHDEKNIYVDRYRYGIKFKFIVSGLMGEFNWYMLMNHLVSTVVLIGVARTTLSYFVMYFLGRKSEVFKKHRFKYIESDSYKTSKKSSKLNLNTNKYNNTSDNSDNSDYNNTSDEFDMDMDDLSNDREFNNKHFHKQFTSLKAQFESVH